MSHEGRCGRLRDQTRNRNARFATFTAVTPWAIHILSGWTIRATADNSGPKLPPQRFLKPRIRGPHPDVQVGLEFVIELRARFDSETFHRQVTFVASGDEASDVFISAVGPGGHAEPKAGLLRRRRYSGFEFGVMVSGATTEQGTRIRDVLGPLIEHRPTNGVGAAASA